MEIKQLNNENYSSFKKTEKVYFSGELAFPIVLIIIASAITYGLLYVFGSTIAVLFNVVISWCSYFYFYYYGKSNINITFGFLKGVFLILLLLLFVDYGIYALVVYQKTGFFNTLYFQLWSVLLFGIPVLYYVFQQARYYFEASKEQLNFFKVLLTVHHDRELLMQIDNIQFVNTRKATMSDVKLEKAPCFYSEKELKKMDSNGYHSYSEKSVFDESIHMPFNTNFLFMSWYSIIEDTYYDIKLPFPFEKMILEQQKYPTNVSAVLRGKRSKPLNLHIHTNGAIRLFNSDTVLIDHPYSNPSSIAPEDKNQKIELHRSSHEYYSKPKAFLDLTEKIRTSGNIEERELIQKKLILWNMSVSGLKGNNYFDVFDVSFNEYKSENGGLEESVPRFLPNKIEIIYRGDYLYRWLILSINTQELYHCIQKITAQSDQIPVSFNLVFENASNTDLIFTISGENKSEVFTNWEIQIDKDRKQSMEDHLLDRDEDEQKRALLKEAWELVANGQYDLAQQKCDTIKAIDPSYGFAYFLELRLVWYKKGFEACYAKKEYFISKTQHEPAALAHIYNGYGCLLDQQLHYEESLLDFEKAIAANPKEGMYVCNLAEMYCKLKNPKKALEFAEKSKKLGHESVTVNILLESKGINYK